MVDGKEQEVALLGINISHVPAWCLLMFGLTTSWEVCSFVLHPHSNPTAPLIPINFQFFKHHVALSVFRPFAQALLPAQNAPSLLSFFLCCLLMLFPASSPSLNAPPQLERLTAKTWPSLPIFYPYGCLGLMTSLSKCHVFWILKYHYFVGTQICILGNGA